MAIESDVRAADENLYAEFYVKPVKQNFASEEAGRPIFADVVAENHAYSPEATATAGLV